jgi:hydroxymethylbilane synthase|tara:strand:- start:43 stop:786 length:744 start_codon:yes stop_codon:yes gene_type:complete
VILRIGVRGSKLALAYADRVCNALPCDTEIVIIKTAGDLNPDVPIHEIGGKGVFCSAIETALLNNKIDIAVHSLKDMPGDIEHPDLEISAVLERNSPYDVLLGKIFDGFVLGTSSPRRTAQLKKLYAHKNIVIKPIRGNIDTRLEKLDNGEYDALVLAEAGLQALSIARTNTRLPIIPAVGQGIIALQTRQNSEASGIAKQINHTLTYAQAQLERALLKGIAGDCTTKVAALASGSDPIKMEAEYYD